jgi:CheY-like chemotaxis protein
MSSGVAIEKMKPAGNPRILVVDDDDAVAECVSLFLSDAGYAVDALTDSTQALDRITAHIDGYDVLVSDNSMPHLTGTQLIGQMRKAGFRGKIVVYSGSVSVDEEQEFKAIGADAVLRKPFDLKLLVPTIIDLCSHEHGGWQSHI